MKLSTLVLLVILGVIGYKIWQVTVTEPVPPPPVQAKPAVVASNPIPESTPMRPREWPRAALEVIHGKVTDVTRDGLAIATMEVERATMNTHHPTVQGVRDAQKRGEEEDRKIFGPVMTMENGTSLHAAREIPTVKATGWVTLKDYPNQVAPGTLINIVAAPLGNLVYTARFNAPPEDPSAWRLKNKGVMDPN